MTNPSLDLYKISFNVKETLWGFYNYNFIMNFRLFHNENNSYNLIREDFAKKTEPGRLEKVWKDSNSLYDLEELSNEICYGRTDHAQVQKESSGIHKIKFIKNTPILVLKSANDPIIKDNGINDVKTLALASNDQPVKNWVGRAISNPL